MCPETHDSNDIRLYKCTEFPMKWEFDRILIKNVSAADTNIFHHENKWWIMTNIDSSDLGVKLDYHEHDSELHIFYADSLDSNNWISHPKNPVIFFKKWNKYMCFTCMFWEGRVLHLHVHRRRKLLWL